MTFEPGTPPAAAATDDHVLAELAGRDRRRAGCSRSAPEGLEGRELKDAGDRAAHELLMTLLAEHRPGRRRAVRGGATATTRSPALREPGLDRRPARRHPRVLRAAARRLGRARRPLGRTASWSPAPSPSRRWARRSTPARRPSYRRAPPSRPRIAVSRSRPPAFVDGAGRGARRRAGADGLGRREGDLGGARRHRRLRARRRPVRVGLRRPGRRGPRRRAVHARGSTARRCATTRTTSTCPT